MQAKDEEPLIPTINNGGKPDHYKRSMSYAYDELHTFRSYLKWMCVDQSSPSLAILSWTVFLFFTLAVPSISHFFLACPSCNANHSRPYDGVVQFSLSTVASVSFLCLSQFVKKFGLRRFLFFDTLCDESETVREGYTVEFNYSLKLLSVFVLPCFLLDCAYKFWWYASGGSRIPFMGNPVLSDAIACLLELCSWLYRTTVIFLVCVLFHLICHLQILRLQDFSKVFHSDCDVESVLWEHLRIRKHLRIISHRYRAFVLWILVLVTGSQFASLLITTKPGAVVDVYRTGELALCSITLVTALLIILRSAAKITHKAQAMTSLATKWHVCATLDAFHGSEIETPRPSFPAHFLPDDSADDEDDLDASNHVMPDPFGSVSFQKRQALVSYLENNKAGITVYGFSLDRSTLHSIFGVELALVLWLLGKTIGIS